MEQPKFNVGDKVLLIETRDISVKALESKNFRKEYIYGDGDNIRFGFVCYVVSMIASPMYRYIYKLSNFHIADELNKIDFICLVIEDKLEKPLISKFRGTYL